MYTKRRRKKEEEERGIPGEYQFKTTFRRIPRIAYTYAVLFVIPFHQPLGPGCCFIISFLPCTPLSLPRRRPICLCAHRYYACCIMHCAARWTYARMRAPTSLPKMPRSGGVVVEMYLAWKTSDNSRDAKRFDRFKLRDRNAFPVEEFVSCFSRSPLFKRYQSWNIFKTEIVRGEVWYHQCFDSFSIFTQQIP